jgi:hypothetical protein
LIGSLVAVAVCGGVVLVVAATVVVVVVCSLVGEVDSELATHYFMVIEVSYC